MTRQPFDEFSKQLFETLLTPYGRVSTDRNVPGEARRIDIDFEPTDLDELDQLAIALLNFNTIEESEQWLQTQI